MQYTFYNVYMKPKGEKRELLARFVSRVDATNYAYDMSRGKFKGDYQSVIVIDSITKRKDVRFKNGRRV